MSEKYNAALGAYELIAKGKKPLILGIGTGSTTDQFTEHFLPKLRKRINEVFSSSNHMQYKHKSLTRMDLAKCTFSGRLTAGSQV